jgi:Transposase C of IS166 homeodomain
MSSASALQDENLELKRVIAQMAAEALAKDQHIELQAQRVAAQEQRLCTQEQRLAAQMRQIEHLLEQFHLARQRLIGVSSEKAPGQNDLFNEAEMLAGLGADEDDEPLASAAHRPARKSRGARRPLPAHLPRVEIRHSLPQD